MHSGDDSSTTGLYTGKRKNEIPVGKDQSTSDTDNVTVIEHTIDTHTSVKFSHLKDLVENRLGYGHSTMCCSKRGGTSVYVKEQL